MTVKSEGSRMKVEKCQSIAKSGNPCGATVVADGMCAWHAPSWDARRRAWSAEGGRKRSNAARAKKALPAGMGVDDIDALLGAVLRGVLIDRFTPGQANAAAAVAKAMIAVREAGAIERLEERLNDLERLAARGRSA